MLFRVPYYTLFFTLLFSVSQSLAGATNWTWHSFPGKLHVERGAPGSEEPYRGYDRSEWISAFGVSPVLAEGHESPFMLMATDIGAVIYSSDGESWIPADLPHTGGVAVGFDPHDGNTGYAITHKLQSPQICFLFRTRDRGKTWTKLTDASYYRIQRNMIAVNPDPAMKDHIYIATTTGVKRSLDDGATWEVIPETEGIEIRTIEFNADGSSLYIINGTVVDENLAPGDINLYRMDFDGQPGGSYSFTQLRIGDARDIQPHPTDPDRALLLTRLRRFVWTNDRGATNGEDITPSGINRASYSRINPANPDHILLFGKEQPDVSYFWTTDGGTTWDRPQTINVDGKNYWPQFVDYAPFNHGAPDGLFVERFDSIIEGTRIVVNFWPGQPEWVVSWGISQKTKGPYLSKNYGASFEPFGWGGLFKEHNQMAIGSSDDIMAVARIEYGIAHTDNGGLWWRSSSVANDPVIGEIQANGSGYSWSKSTFHGVAIDPEDDQHWIGLYGNGPAWIIRSRDQGLTWEKVLELSDFTLLRSSYYHRRWVFWHQQDPNVIYAGSWKSEDRGLTWTEFENNRAVTDISSENGDVVLHRAFGEYWFSRDAGETWHRIPPPPRNPVTLALGPEIPNGRNAGIVAIDPDPLRDPTVPGQFLRFLAGTKNGVVEFVASNQDATAGTWTIRDEGLITDDDQWIGDNQAIYFASIAFDPREGHHHIAYAGAGKGWNTTRTSTNDKYYRQIYRSEDAGLTWSRIVTDADVAAGEVPNYMNITGPFTVSRNTGKLYVHAWTGMYVYDPDPDALEWRGFPVTGTGWADTGQWLGWLYVEDDPWLWSNSLQGYLFWEGLSSWIFKPRP